jgi:hypothetical protein
MNGKEVRDRMLGVISHRGVCAQRRHRLIRKQRWRKSAPLKA